MARIIVVTSGKGALARPHQARLLLPAWPRKVKNRGYRFRYRPAEP